MLAEQTVTYRLLAYDWLEAVKCSAVQRFVHILNLKPHLCVTVLVLRVLWQSNKSKEGPKSTYWNTGSKENKQATVLRNGFQGNKGCIEGATWGRKKIYWELSWTKKTRTLLCFIWRQQKWQVTIKYFWVFVCDNFLTKAHQKVTQPPFYTFCSSNIIHYIFMLLYSVLVNNKQ